MSDLISEGNLGMMHAVKKFEPEKGFRLATYAMWWIKAAIQEYILRSWSLVKIGTTAGQKSCFLTCAELKGKFKQLMTAILKPEHVTQIANRLDVSEREVISMNQRMAGNDRSLNVPLAVMERAPVSGKIGWKTIAPTKKPTLLKRRNTTHAVI